MMPRQLDSAPNAAYRATLLFLLIACPAACGAPQRAEQPPESVDQPVPALHVEPTTLTFTGSAGGPDPAFQHLTISNQGGGHVGWSVKVSGPGGWLRVARQLPGGETSGVEGAVSASSPPLDVFASLDGLAPGIYNAGIDVVSNAGTVTVPVFLTVHPPSR